MNGLQGGERLLIHSRDGYLVLQINGKNVAEKLNVTNADKLTFTKI